MNLFQRSHLGIDIGQRTLKAVKLMRKGQGKGSRVHLEQYFFQDLAESSEEYPKNTKLPEVLKSISEINGLQGKRVAICLDDSEVLTFELTLPRMPKAELTTAIANSIEQQLPFPLDEAVIDHVVLEEKSEDSQDGSSLTIKAYCSKIERIRHQLELFNGAGLRVQSVDVAMLSNLAMLDFNGYLEDETAAAVIDLGESKVNVALAVGKKLALINSIPVAPGTVVRQLMEKQGLSYREAEQLKVNSTSSHETDPVVAHIIDEVYVDLFQQIQRSIDFFRATVGQTSIQRIYFVGGGVHTPAICKTIEQICHIESTVANPFRNIEIFTKGNATDDRLAHLAPHMGTAVGLALRGLDGS